jgi:uronate dehydrogenase
MSESQRILVTGSAGRLGRAAVRELLARGHRVVGLDRVPTPGLTDDQTVVVSIQDADALRRAAEGVQCLIHLAACPDDARFPRGMAPHDGDNFLEELVPSNIVGPYQVMEAVRTSGIPRVILASTGQVIDGYLRDGRVPVTVDLPPRPRYLYACTKVFLEALGQVYAREHGMAVLAVRLGWCPRPGQRAEFDANPLGPDVYLSSADAGRFFAAAVEAPTIEAFSVVYATSRPVSHPLYDLEPARRLIGYEPQDQWPAGAEEFD